MHDLLVSAAMDLVETLVNGMLFHEIASSVARAAINSRVDHVGAVTLAGLCVALLIGPTERNHRTHQDHRLHIIAMLPVRYHLDIDQVRAGKSEVLPLLWSRLFCNRHLDYRTNLGTTIGIISRVYPDM